MPARHGCLSGTDATKPGRELLSDEIHDGVLDGLGYQILGNFLDPGLILVASKDACLQQRAAGARLRRLGWVKENYCDLAHTLGPACQPRRRGFIPGPAGDSNYSLAAWRAS